MISHYAYICWANHLSQLERICRLHTAIILYLRQNRVTKAVYAWNSKFKANSLLKQKSQTPITTEIC